MEWIIVNLETLRVIYILLISKRLILLILQYLSFSIHNNLITYYKLV